MKTTRIRVRDTLSNLPVFTCEQAKAIDAAAIENGTPGFCLMMRAGQSAFDLLKERWPKNRSLLIFCGSGNNGGDGYIVAGLAAKERFEVRVIGVGDGSKLSDDAQAARAFALDNQVCCCDFDGHPGFLRSISKADNRDKPFIIVDALLGIGFSGALRSPYEQIVKHINQLESPVIAIDIPSGLDGNLGCFDDSRSARKANTIVRADLTITFIALKKGLCTGAAKNYIGDLYLDSLAVDVPVLGRQASAENSISSLGCEPDQEVLSLPVIRKALAKRASDSHKGSYGRVAHLGGACGMGGAILMSAEMCLSAGAGLTTIYTHSSNVSAVLVRIPEAMTRAVDDPASAKEELARGLHAATVFVCGPGMGAGDWGRALLEELFSAAEHIAAPIVLDADALNLLAKRCSGSRMPGCIDKLPGNCVFTPHPGEAARLLGCSISDIQSDRYTAVKKLYERYGGVVVLKGAGTLIFNGDKIHICPYGNPGMSIGGMGDVLSGLIGALLAQGLSALDAANLGVCAHSYAADIQANKEGEIGLRPTHLIPLIRSVLNGTASG